MSKWTLLGLAAAVIGACNGEIGGLPSDLGPARSLDDDLTTTLSVSNGWRTVEASEPAYDTLELELIARPGGAQLDAGIAVAAQQSVELSETPIRVRFGEDGFIDVQDGGQWTNSTMMPYEAHVWYRIRISADVATQTYAVEVEPQYDVKRGPQQQGRRTLIEGAAFDPRAQKEKWLAVWTAWSSNDYTLDIAEPSWLVSGRCAPASCQSLGAECGVMGDGCGGTLSCGVCDAAEACRGGTCVDLCAPENCVSLGVECGTVSDGCGGTVTCGECANGQACTEGLCVDACVPETCLALGVECGAVSDGCGGVLSCGGCASGLACMEGVCEYVCTPATCASWGVECGTLDDGCGGTSSCGGCQIGELCSFGSCVSASQPPPPCVPDACQSLGVACGAASDGCGGTLSCGGCQSGQACLEGVCENVCMPRTCASLGIECGTASDGCGDTLSCGGCANGQACKVGVCENVCVPETCLSLGVECGAASDGCGGALRCGDCAVGRVCEAGVCAAASPPSCDPYTCGEIGASCGTQSDGCGGVLSCGSCASGRTCSSGQCVAAGSKEFFATRTACMAPCAVQFDAQKTENLTWATVRDSEFAWDFDDGGGTNDSDGFLAAAVYETAGTYNVTVTVDGETWNAKTITVTDPTWTGCVCTSGTCTGCPTGNHYTTISVALSAAGAQPRHVLLNKGESHGALPSGDSTATMVGAYGSGADPSVTASGMRLTANWSLVDLAIAGGGSTAISPSSDGGLVLRITGTGAPTTSWMSANNGAFIVDSSIVSAAPYTVFTFDNCPWYVIKNSTISRTVSGQHTIRIDGNGQERVLIQDSQILGAGAQHGLSIRGTTSWLLVQGNFFNQQSGTKDSSPGDPRLQSKIVFERNAYDRQNGNTGINWGFTFQGRDIVLRNNIVYNAGGQFDYAVVTGGAGAPSGIWLLNNTSVNNDTNGIKMNNCSTCKVKNNLVYSTNSKWGDCIIGTTGVDVGHNWCFTDDECLDPVDGDGDCYDPRFMSTSYGHPDFARPVSGSRGIDGGDGNVPVWNDFDGLERKTVDVGAVER